MAQRRYVKVRIILLILIILISIFITINIKEKFPSINQVSIAEPYGYYSNYSVIELNKTCFGLYGWLVKVDETLLNEGDRIEIGVGYEVSPGNIKNINSYTLAGFNPNNLDHKLKEGFNSLGLRYYKEGKIIVYTQYCNEIIEDKKSSFQEGRGDAQLAYVSIKRPSFVDSWIGWIVVFLTSFVLLGEFLRLILYFLGKIKD